MRGSHLQGNLPVFTIGEFSKITGLTVKTLRFYHDRNILVPACVDKQTGYRFYESRQIDKARIITQLRSLEFSLEQISEMLASCEDEADILDGLTAVPIKDTDILIVKFRARQPNQSAQILQSILDACVSISRRAVASSNPPTATTAPNANHDGSG